MWIQVLGPLQVSLGGSVLKTGTPQMRTVLAALVARSGELVTVEELATELWGTAQVQDCRRLVQGYISRIRRRFREYGPDAADRIETRDPGYIFHLESSEVDLSSMRMQVEAARAFARKGEFTSASVMFDKALSLCRGMPFSDVRAGPIVHAMSLHCSEFILAVQEERCDTYLFARDPEPIIPELVKLIAENSLREGPVMRLMTALAMVGRRAEALAAFHSLRKVLISELGIEPSHALHRLYLAVLNDSETDDLLKPVASS